MATEINFTYTVDSVETKFTVKLPNLEQLQEANKIQNITFKQSLNSQAILKAKLDDFMREQGLWDDAKQAKLTSLDKEITDNEKVLAGGGISLADAKTIALRVRKLRAERILMLSARRELENKTAEGQAENARFNYLISVCLVYSDTGKPYYKDLQDYLIKAIEPISFVAASHLASLLHGYDNDFEKKLPENKFLLDYGFVNKELQLVDKGGHLVDELGRKINRFGQLVDDEGHLVDEFGNQVDEEGNFVIEFKPFLDEEGNQIENTKNIVDTDKDAMAQDEEPVQVLPKSIKEAVAG